MKQYMTVPSSMGVSGSNATPEAAANLFSQTINQYAQQGWTYHSTETVSVTKTGCLQSFGGNSGNTTTYYVLIFERDV
jgi:hypothetical protein